MVQTESNKALEVATNALKHMERRSRDPQPKTTFGASKWHLNMLVRVGEPPVKKHMTWLAHAAASACAPSFHV